MLWMWVALTAAAGDGERDYGGGGIVLHDERARYYDPGTPWRSDLDTEMICVGGQGFRVGDGLREGGEGHVCFGPGAALVTAGPQIGVIGRGGGFYASLHASGGLGGYGAEGRYGALIAYLKPTAAVAWAPGPFAVELGAYLMLPLEVVAWSQTRSQLGPGVPHFGGQLSLLFGSFEEPDEVAAD